MEQTNQIPEKNFRINFSQTAKGVWNGEYTCRADTIEELTKRVEEVKKLALDQLKILNSGAPVSDPMRYS